MMLLLVYTKHNSTRTVLYDSMSGEKFGLVCCVNGDVACVTSRERTGERIFDASLWGLEKVGTGFGLFVCLFL